MLAIMMSIELCQHTDWSDKGTLVLFSCQHEDGEDELGGQEHLNEESLRDRGTATKCGAYVDFTLVREHARNEGSSSHTTKDLHEEK
jgi:hypothetical protein